MELVGEFPKSLAFTGKYSSEFFNRKGKFSKTDILIFANGLDKTFY